MTDAGAIAMGGGKGNAQLAYTLLLVGLLSGGLSAIVGAGIAYVQRAEAPGWLRTHYAFIIHTFWVGVLGVIVAGGVFGVVAMATFRTYRIWGGLTAGAAVWLLVLIWWIARCLRGLALLRTDSPVPKGKDWDLVH